MQISGLGPGVASRGVRSALECIHGVRQVTMVPDEPYVTVTYDAFLVRVLQFETAVRVMGCKVERMLERSLHGPVDDAGPGAPAALQVDRMAEKTG